MASKMNATNQEHLEAEKLNYCFYDFTATMVTDKIYNAAVDSWYIVYGTVISPALIDPVSPQKAQKKFGDSLLNALFQKGRFDVVLLQWRNYLINSVFNLPSNLTLPEDEPHRFAREKDDEEELLEEEKAWKERVLKIRAQLAIVEKERENTQAAIQAIQEYKNAHQASNV